MISLKRLCGWAVVAVSLALATTASAQQPGQPLRRPAPPRVPVLQPHYYPWPGVPAYLINPQPAINPGPFYNPALNNPWMNQIQVTPFSPLPTIGYNTVLGDSANLLAVNQQLLPNQPVLRFWNSPLTTYTPPLAIQTPGQWFWRGTDLQVNPAAGLVYRPISGYAQASDGTVFYRVPGSGLPTATGMYAPGTGLYYNPEHGAFLHPASGVVSRPGTTTVFIPWIR